MYDYDTLRALSEIIRRGSFDAAAAQLRLTPSAVSQRIKALEERLGLVVLHRGPPVTGTKVGLQLMQHFDQVQLLEQGLDQQLRPSGQTATIRLALNADSLATWFPPAMTVLPWRYDLVIDDQDHARDWLRRGEVSGAITSSPSPVSGCDVTPLGAMRYLALATPAFIARYFPEGVAADALAAAPAVIFNRKDALQARWAEIATGRRCRIAGHMVPSSEAFARTVSLGLGWGMIPEGMAQPDLQPLDPLLPLDIPLYWQVTRAMSAALAPLTREIRKRAAMELRPLS